MGKSQVGGSLGIVSAYNTAAKYSNTIKPKNIAIFKLIGSFGKTNATWVPNFLKHIQTAVHDSYINLSLANAKIYHIMYELHSDVRAMVGNTDPTVPPDIFPEAHAVILQDFLRDHKTEYDTKIDPLIQKFKDATKLTDDALHEFVKAVKEACEEEGGNSMNEEQRKKMDVLLQKITDVISITGSPKSAKSSSSTSKGGRRIKKTNKTKKNRRSQ